nr:MAG TPA: hypothetical protein [Crassvirales sp.]
MLLLTCCFTIKLRSHVTSNLLLYPIKLWSHHKRSDILTNL